MIFNKKLPNAAPIGKLADQTAFQYAMSSSFIPIVIFKVFNKRFVSTIE
jgi:hypothetical protein